MKPNNTAATDLALEAHGVTGNYTVLPSWLQAAEEYTIPP
jgi:hypothetical protein